MTKKGWGITAIAVVAVIFFILLTYSCVYDRLVLVEKGLASPNFPYTKYSQEELNKMYPQYPLENISTTQSPEETYNKFLEYVKANDEKNASSLFVGSNKEDFVNALDNAKKNGNLSNLYSKLPKEIKKEYCWDTICEYKGVPNGESITFRKTFNGMWLIKSL